MSSVVPAHIQSLMRLRWVAILAQVIMICVMTLTFEVAPVWGVWAGLLGFEVVSNLLLHGACRHGVVLKDGVMALVIGLDIVLLTGLLFATGGALNPFSFLYLIHLAVAAVTLRHWATGLHTIVAIGSYALLFVLPSSHSGGHAHHGHHNPETLLLHLEGMLWAFALTAVALVLVVYDVRKALAKQSVRLGELERKRAHALRLAGLMGLAAGAAHELSTPLSTIALVSGELLWHLKRHDPPDAAVLREEAEAIRDEVARCKAILTELAGHTGHGRSEGFVSCDVSNLWEQACEELPGGAEVTVDCAPEVLHATVKVPLRPLAQALRGAVRNAIHADPGGTVMLQGHLEAGMVHLEVVDQGCGMTEAVRAQAFDPFFTTKAEGDGMGLGLFLLHTMVHQLGGAVHLQSAPNQGTTLLVTLPLERA